MSIADLQVERSTQGQIGQILRLLAVYLTINLHPFAKPPVFIVMSVDFGCEQG